MVSHGITGFGGKRVKHKIWCNRFVQKPLGMRGLVDASIKVPNET